MSAVQVVPFPDGTVWIAATKSGSTSLRAMCRTLTHSKVDHLWVVRNGKLTPRRPGSAARKRARAAHTAMIVLREPLERCVSGVRYVNQLCGTSRGMRDVMPITATGEWDAKQAGTDAWNHLAPVRTGLRAALDIRALRGIRWVRFVDMEDLSAEFASRYRTQVVANAAKKDAAPGADLLPEKDLALAVKLLKDDLWLYVRVMRKHTGRVRVAKAKALLGKALLGK